MQTVLINLEGPLAEKLLAVETELANQRAALAQIQSRLERAESPDRLLTKKQAGEILGVSARTVERLIQAGTLPAIEHIYGGTRITRAAVNDYIVANEKRKARKQRAS